MKCFTFTSKCTEMLLAAGLRKDPMDYLHIYSDPLDFLARFKGQG